MIKCSLGLGTANRLMFFICPWPLIFVYSIISEILNRQPFIKLHQTKHQFSTLFRVFFFRLPLYTFYTYKIHIWLRNLWIFHQNWAFSKQTNKKKTLWLLRHICFSLFVLYALERGNEWVYYSNQAWRQ